MKHILLAFLMSFSVLAEQVTEEVNHDTCNLIIRPGFYRVVGGTPYFAYYTARPNNETLRVVRAKGYNPIRVDDSEFVLNETLTSISWRDLNSALNENEADLILDYSATPGCFVGNRSSFCNIKVDLQDYSATSYPVILGSANSQGRKRNYERIVREFNQKLDENLPRCVANN